MESPSSLVFPQLREPLEVYLQCNRSSELVSAHVPKSVVVAEALPFPVCFLVKLDFAFDTASQSKFPSLKTLGGTIDVLCESHASTLSVNRSWFPVQSGKKLCQAGFCV